VAPAPGSAGSGSGQQGGFPALQLTDEQLQKLRESVAAGTKDGATKALNNLTITQE
jgi:Spy/CpxP family protein refolding chaperone